MAAYPGAMSAQTKLSGPDLAEGVAAGDVPEGGVLLGHARGEAVLLVRRGREVYALGATCTHHGGPLAEGLVVGDTIRCPWHHAGFSLHTGEATRGPALAPAACYEVEQRADGRLVVLERREPPTARRAGDGPSSVLVVGAGTAGNACVEALRREGYGGPITLLGAEGTGPVDRPNLSKDYLAGTAPEEWMTLRGEDFYREHEIDFVPRGRVVALDVAARRASLESGATRSYGAVVLATGAQPNRLAVPGADAPHVFTLRTLADSRSILARAAEARRAVVVGASFIGLEVAASLRARGLDVHVVGKESVPLARVLGDSLGALVRRVHEANGVRFHLGTGPRAIGPASVTLEGGEELAADLVVTGVGVQPDVARWPDARTGERIRVEHWVVAGRMGQIAAKNVLGAGMRCDIVPFFWSAHFDLTIQYVGHAERWGRIDVAGDPAARDAAIAYRQGDRTLAVATIGRDRVSLEAAAAMEVGDEPALRAMVPPAA